MRIYLSFLILFFYCADLLALALHYTIEKRVDNNKAELIIKLHFNSNDSGVTRINFPSHWAGMKDVSKGLYSFSLDQSDAVLENKNDYLCIYSSPNEMLTLNYRVGDQVDHSFKPKVKDDFFWFIGRTVFLTPQVVSFDEDIKIEIDWNDEKIFNSFGSGIKKQSVDTTLNKFLDSLFLGGDLENKIFSAENNTFNLVVYPAEILKNEQIIKLVEETVSRQYETMTGEAQNYLISLLELNNTESVGINLNNAFSMIFSNLDKYSLDSFLYFLIHEHYHTWIGKKIMSTDDYEHQMWFMEGFNDFCAMLHAYESGLISFERYIDIYNKILKSYLTSPLKNIPYQVTAERYWADEAASLQLYPYRAGHVFAQEINYLLKLEDPSNSLIKVFKHILETYKKDLPLVLNTQDILNLLDTYAHQDASILWEKYFRLGETIPSRADLFGDIAQLIMEEIEIVDYGFDFGSAYQFNTIQGVKEKSNAALAGLQNYQEIQSMHLKYYPESISLTMNTGERKCIRPNKIKVKIPKYILKDKITLP